MDCQGRERGMCIPWLKYVKVSLEGIGCKDLFLNPLEITRQDKKRVKELFSNLVASRRYLQDGGKQSVQAHSLLRTGEGMEPYLALLPNAQDRFLITRFRLNLLHHLLADPPGFTASVEQKGPCGCDHRSPQDTLHFVLLCPFYSLPRRRFLVSILKQAKFRQARVALVFLQMANDPLTLFCILNFVRLALKLRKTRGKC